MSNGYEYFLKTVLLIAFGAGIISYVIDKNEKHKGDRS